MEENNLNPPVDFLWNVAGVNGEVFRTNASDNEIMNIWNALVITGHDDVRHLKESLELNGFLCGEIERRVNILESDIEEAEMSILLDEINLLDPEDVKKLEESKRN